MEVEIVEDRENRLLRRREVRFKLSYIGKTPTRQEVRGKLAALLNSDKELTVLDKVKSEYGSQTALGYVKVYADREAMKTEPEYMLKRNFGVKEKAAAGGGGAAVGGGAAPEGGGAAGGGAAEGGVAAAGGGAASETKEAG